MRSTDAERVDRGLTSTRFETSIFLIIWRPSLVLLIIKQKSLHRRKFLKTNFLGSARISQYRTYRDRDMEAENLSVLTELDNTERPSLPARVELRWGNEELRKCRNGFHHTSVHVQCQIRSSKVMISPARPKRTDLSSCVTRPTNKWRYQVGTLQC